jgi:hypothetical protein
MLLREKLKIPKQSLQSTVRCFLTVKKSEDPGLGFFSAPVVVHSLKKRVLILDLI